MHHPLYVCLEDADRAALPAPYTVGKGKVLIEEGDLPRFFFLLSGSVEVYYVSQAGEQLTAKIFSAPGVFGEVECMTQSPMHESVRVVVACKVISIDSRTFEQLTRTSPAFTRALLWDMGRRLEVSILHEKVLAFAQAGGRLINFVLSLVKAYGVERERRVVIEREHTQESPAEAIGVDRRSVTRTLNRLKSERVLAKDGRFFVVEDLGRLESLVSDVVAPLFHQSRILTSQAQPFRRSLRSSGSRDAI